MRGSHQHGDLTLCRTVEISKAERLLSYSLLSLITTKPIATLPSAGVTIREEDLFFQSDQEESDEDEEPKKAKGYVNEQGAWCWREGCEGVPSLRTRFSTIHTPSDCLKLTGALQKTSETLQSVADLYDNHVRGTYLTSRWEILIGFSGAQNTADYA